MLDSLRCTFLKANIFYIITLALIISILTFFNGIASNVSNPFHPIDQSYRSNQLQTTHQTSQQLLKIITSEDQSNGAAYLVPSLNVVHKLVPQEFGLFASSSDSVSRFDFRVRDFFRRNQCQLQIFMTWIAPVDSFGQREFFALESLFQSNPSGCVIILSTSLDSLQGHKILEPLINKGFRVESISPDFSALLSNTPAERWLIDIKNGNKDPGEIPLAQNLSNLIRLVVLYKYGGVYLDTDVIILKPFLGLRNTIGAQSVGVSGNWTRLNNAVLIFDKNHHLIYKFIEEFSLNFNGDIWGYNGPYLVSRVVNKAAEAEEAMNFTVLPPMAFYPVSWTRIAVFFTRPNDRAGAKWVNAKIQKLKKLSYGVHLWNSRSKAFKIEEGSIIGRLISDHCVVCSSSSSNQSSRS